MTFYKSHPRDLVSRFNRALQPERYKLAAPPRAGSAKWEESKHPRDGGKFTSGPAHGADPQAEPGPDDKPEGDDPYESQQKEYAEQQFETAIEDPYVMGEWNKLSDKDLESNKKFGGPFAALMADHIAKTRTGPTFEELGEEGVDPISGEATIDLADAGDLARPREEMPQIPEEKIDQFLDYLTEKLGVKVNQSTKIPADKLKPSQVSVKVKKTMKFYAAMEKRQSIIEAAVKAGEPIPPVPEGDYSQWNFDTAATPAVTSSDGYILDGHHRWAALSLFNQRHGTDHAMDVHQVDLPLKPLLDTAGTFQGTSYRNIKDEPGTPIPGSDVWTGEGTTVHADPASLSAASKVIGQTVNHQQLAGMVGAPPGHTVRVMASTRGRLGIETGERGSAIYSERSLHRAHNGDLEMLLHYSDAPGGGVGTAIFNSLATNAKAMGVKRLKFSAERGEDYNGYYSYAVFGADGKIPPKVQQAIAQDPNASQFKNAQSVQDIVATPEGKAWWKENGDTYNATFELTDDSGIGLLDKYRATKQEMVAKRKLARLHSQYRELYRLTGRRTHGRVLA